MKRIDFCCASALGAVALLVPGISPAFATESRAGEIRLTSARLNALEPGGAIGSSHVAGIAEWGLKGNPAGPGVYTIALRVPRRTQIHAHWHPDDRVATVVRGTWHFGYGERFDPSKLEALPAGSFYTEPARRGHFALTGDEDVLVYITGYGPTGTTYYNAGLDPLQK